MKTREQENKRTREQENKRTREQEKMYAEMMVWKITGNDDIFCFG